jgi:Ca2+-binding RTX toxin-like protein
MADVTVFGGTNVETVASNVSQQSYIQGQALANAIDQAFPSAVVYEGTTINPPNPSAEYLFVDSVTGPVDASGYAAIVVPASVSGATGPVTIDGGGTGSQTVLSGSQGMILIAQVGNESVDALGGSNFVFFDGVYSDSLYTGSGTTTVFGSTTNTTVNAGGADDLIRTEGGTTDVNLGTGASTVQITGGTVVVDGSSTSPTAPGFSLVMYASAAFTGTVTGGDGSYFIDASLGTGVFEGGSSGGNLIIGGSSVATLMGGGNNDSLYGGAGTTLIEGASGDETLTGAIGSYTSLVAGTGNDYFAIEGTDTVQLSVGAATVTVGSGSAYVVGDTNSGAISSSLVFQGGTEASTVIGGVGSVDISASLGGGYFKGGSSGNNLIYGDTQSGAGSVTILGGGAGDYLGGSSGGSDSLVAGAANETLASGTGNATMVGSGAGSDVFNFLQAAAGSTYTVDGFQSSDYLYYSGSNLPTGTADVGGNTTITLADSTKIVLETYGTSGINSGHS